VPCSRRGNSWRLLRRKNDLSSVHSNPQEPDQKHHHDNEGDRTNKRGCPTEIAKYSSLDIIVGAERGSAYGTRGGTGGTWPAMATAGDVPAPVARWAALLTNGHKEPPLQRMSDTLTSALDSPRSCHPRSSPRTRPQRPPVPLSSCALGAVTCSRGIGPSES